ncbi:hypothetical protein HSISB1_615 [Streptococcus sp. HSISB1]|nr:hypothetical protein HSISB1_615 [Streptococcus sp. HSISB1]
MNQTLQTNVEMIVQKAFLVLAYHAHRILRFPLFITLLNSYTD